MKTFIEWLESFTDDYAANSYDHYGSLLAKMKKLSPRLANKAEIFRQKNPSKLDKVINWMAQKLAEIEHGVPDTALPSMNTGNMDRFS